MTSGIDKGYRHDAGTSPDAGGPDAGGPIADERVADAALVADVEERFAQRERAPLWTRARFLALLLLVLLIHAAILLALLIRDADTHNRVASIEETPIEIVVEKPPEPPPLPPPPPKPPEPQPKPKEEIEKPALSAPRAPNEEKVETEKTQPKTVIPKAPQPPSEGEKQPKAAAAPPKEAAPDEAKEDAAKAPDDTRPDAEPLDKAKPKTARKTTTKQAKAAPKRKQKTTDMLASLGGSSPLDTMSLAKPTAKSPVYGGTEDVRYLAIVEGLLVHKVSQLPRTAHWQDGGHVVIFFQLDPSGRVISKDFYVKSGYPEIDQLAMRALLAAQPFPPPPRGLDRGLVWGSQFDGQLPHYTMTKR